MLPIFQQTPTTNSYACRPTDTTGLVAPVPKRARLVLPTISVDDQKRILEQQPQVASEPTQAVQAEPPRASARGLPSAFTPTSSHPTSPAVGKLSPSTTTAYAVFPDCKYKPAPEDAERARGAATLNRVRAVSGVSRGHRVLEIGRCLAPPRDASNPDRRHLKGADQRVVPGDDDFLAHKFSPKARGGSQGNVYNFHVKLDAHLSKFGYF